MQQETARTATAADFDRAAQNYANNFWLWAIVAAVVGYFAGWLAVIPGLLAALAIVFSMSATSAATKLRNGTFPVPNPNNGAPDGDAALLKREDAREKRAA